MAARPLRTNTGACVVSQIVIWLAARVPLRHHAAGLDRRGDAVLVAEAALEDAVRACAAARAIVALALVDMRRDVGAEVVVDVRR